MTVTPWFSWKCPFCDIRFPHAIPMLRHAEQMHPKEFSEAGTNPSMYLMGQSRAQLWRGGGD